MGSGVSVLGPSMVEGLMVCKEATRTTFNGGLKAMDGQAGGKLLLIKGALLGLSRGEMLTKERQWSPLTTMKLLEDGTSTKIAGVQENVEGASTTGWVSRAAYEWRLLVVSNAPDELSFQTREEGKPFGQRRCRG